MTKKFPGVFAGGGEPKPCDVIPMTMDEFRSRQEAAAAQLPPLDRAQVQEQVEQRVQEQAGVPRVAELSGQAVMNAANEVAVEIARATNELMTLACDVDAEGQRLSDAIRMQGQMVREAIHAFAVAARHTKQTLEAERRNLEVAARGGQA